MEYPSPDKGTTSLLPTFPSKKQIQGTCIFLPTREPDAGIMLPTL